MADHSTLDRNHAERGLPALGLELVVMANEKFARYPLPVAGVVLLGRGADADVEVDDPLVSRRHARVHVGDAVEVEDLGGRNGTVVGGRRLAERERVTVAPGVTIGIGEAMIVVQPAPARGVAAPAAAGPLSDPGSSALRHIPAHIVIADEEMRRIYRLAALVARSPINVLLLGDTGVGKELLAQTVHACSERAAGPFVALNCATFSDTLLESELFGHEKGAFTGAVQTKPGLLEAAAGGTVFLDEVGEMPVNVQARLLRVLGAEESRRIGALKAKPLDVRFVSATNRDLAAAVERGDFRGDLYYRLNGMTLHVPPLRARPGEIGRLAERFIAMATQAMGRPRRPALTDDALARLKSHDWPGNVRELKNVIDRAVLMCRVRDIEPRDVVFDGDGLRARSDAGAATSTARPVREEIADLERERIVEALEAHGWNQTRAARALGMARGTLIKRMEVYGLSRPRKAP